MKKLLATFFVSLLLVIGCQPTDNGYEPTPITQVSFSYVDEEGMDILDPDTFDFFNVYYLQKNDESGEFELNRARTPQYRFQKNINNGLYALRLFPNPEYIDGYSTTYIESARDDIDTLEVQARVEGRGIIPEAVWYNGEQLWEQGTVIEELYFTITKPSGSF